MSPSTAYRKVVVPRLRLLSTWLDDVCISLLTLGMPARFSQISSGRKEAWNGLSQTGILHETLKRLASAVRGSLNGAANVKTHRTDALKTRTTLLSKVRRGDEDGWNRFYALYQRVIYATARAAALSHQEAEDVVQ